MLKLKNLLHTRTNYILSMLLYGNIPRMYRLIIRIVIPWIKTESFYTHRNFLISLSFKENGSRQYIPIEAFANNPRTRDLDFEFLDINDFSHYLLTTPEH